VKALSVTSRAAESGQTAREDLPSGHHQSLASFAAQAMQLYLESAGAELRYLPPYSPDFNPIENVFSKIKAKLRAAAKRTVLELEDYLGEMVDVLAPEECHNYFRHCGYRVSTPSREPL
jgi:HEPN domain-containing protein